MRKRLLSLDIKIVVLGSAFVGKTSIITRYCENSFSESQSPTIGAGFFTRMEIFPDLEATVMMWDTAGSERFKCVTPSLIRGSNGLVLVFDLSQPSTFEELDHYFKSFCDVCGTVNNAVPNVILLGNKSDIGSPAVSDASVQRWCQEHRVETYSPVSAKTGENVDNVIRKFVESLVGPQITECESSRHISLPIDQRPSRDAGCC
jgi:small GTP-binding protein